MAEKQEPKDLHAKEEDIVWWEHIARINRETEPEKIKQRGRECAQALRDAQDEIAELNRQIDKAETAEQKADRDLKQAHAARQAVAAKAIRALAKLLPKAIQQASAGKPALLRLILRATK